MLPIALSAVLSPTAAAFEANVSGKDVPSATKVIAVKWNIHHECALAKW